MMLINAIEPSPHTTTQNKNNKTIHKYPDFLKGGGNSELNRMVEGLRNKAEDDDDMVDVLSIGG